MRTLRWGMFGALFAVLIVPSSSLSARRGDAPGAPLRYAGATTLQQHYMPDAARAFAARTGITIRIAGGNTDAGLKALAAGGVDLAGAGRFLTPAEKRAGLIETLIGWDPLAVVVNAANPVENLTREELQGIFSGRIANWRQVGGPDLPVLVITSPQGSGMRAAVADLLLDGEGFTPREIVPALVSDGDDQVARMRGAICALSKSMVDAPGIRSLRIGGVPLTAEGNYPLRKPLLLVTRRAPRAEVARFVAFSLSAEGQGILARTFFRVKPE